MIARRSVWPDERVQSLLRSFVPAADEVWRLQHAEGPECDLFRKIAEQGHYAGRTVPSDTRQGIYATTPSGVLLASANTQDPRRIAELLDEARHRFADLPDAERFLPAEALTEQPVEERWERLLPVDGMVLRVVARDLPRGADGPASGGGERSRGGPPARSGRRTWKQYAWNQDYAWFRKEELRAFLPKEHVVGATREVDARLVRRLVTLHLVDDVRGQVQRFDDEDVQLAELVSRIASVEGDTLVLHLEGRTRARTGLSTEPGTRGVETNLVGTATFDLSRERFTRFDLVAAGTRFGRTEFNARERDEDSAGIAFAMTLLPDPPHVAPAFVWAYGW